MTGFLPLLLYMLERFIINYQWFESGSFSGNIFKKFGINRYIGVSELSLQALKTGLGCFQLSDKG
jgi:hypothetical protein